MLGTLKTAAKSALEQEQEQIHIFTTMLGSFGPHIYHRGRVENIVPLPVCEKHVYPKTLHNASFEATSATFLQNDRASMPLHPMHCSS